MHNPESAVRLKLFYIFVGVSLCLYVYHFRYSLVVDFALGPPFIALGYCVLPYFVAFLATYDVFQAERVAVTLFVQYSLLELVVSHSSKRIGFALRSVSTLFSLFLVFASFADVYAHNLHSLNIPFIVAGFVVYALFLYLFGKLCYYSSYIIPVEASTFLYIAARAHQGYPELETYFERLIYEVPFLILHYARFYAETKASGVHGGRGERKTASV